MKVSHDLDIAARILMYLASKPSKASAGVDELAKTQETSEETVASLVEELKKAKILLSRRNGGKEEFLLRYPPSKIHFAMILEAIRGRERWEVSLVHDQTGDVDGDRAGGPAWDEMQKVLLKGLEGYTLDHLTWDTAYHLDSEN